MPMSSEVLRNHLDSVLLAQLEHADGYGYGINREIQTRAGGEGLKEATLYTAFRRLENAGLIRSYWGDEELGARRRYYAITTRGRLTLTRLKAEWETAKELIDRLIAEEVATNAN